MICKMFAITFYGHINDLGDVVFLIRVKQRSLIGQKIGARRGKCLNQKIEIERIRYGYPCEDIL